MKTHLIFGAFLGAALALVGPLAGEGRGDFTLHGNEELIVTDSHDYGYLWDVSPALTNDFLSHPGQGDGMPVLPVRDSSSAALSRTPPKSFLSHLLFS
jgi:hypothetical protein